MVASHFVEGFQLARDHKSKSAFPILDPPFTDLPALAIYGSYGRKTERGYRRR